MTQEWMITNANTHTHDFRSRESNRKTQSKQKWRLADSATEKDKAEAKITIIQTADLFSEKKRQKRR